MIVDITGIPLLPGNGGQDCPGNGIHHHPDGTVIDCCCDECDYYLCCVEDNACENCNHQNCPLIEP